MVQQYEVSELGKTESLNESTALMIALAVGENNIFSQSAVEPWHVMGLLLFLFFYTSDWHRVTQLLESLAHKALHLFKIVLLPLVI